jgi:orotidine-5'-phosphate decarboxylase
VANYRNFLEGKIAEMGSPICLGIDPHFDVLPYFMEQTRESEGDLGILSRFSTVLVDVAAEHFPAVKFQSAFYEAHGWQGFKILQESIHYAKKRGLLVILDAKRGDIASTMRAYGKMAFEALQADCLTVTPYMGTDVVSPLEPWLNSGKGIYLVWLGSNTAADAFFFWTLKNGGCPVGEALLDKFSEFFSHRGLASSVGLVLGATMLSEISAGLLEKAADFPLLLPGVGPQGGKIDRNFKKLLASGRHLIPLSRGLAGLGDQSCANQLSRLNSWEEYQEFVDSRCLAAMAEPGEACEKT